MSTDEFDFDAGELCLDFANTAEWHASDEPDEKLEGYGDLLRWGEAAGILPPRQAERLKKAAAQQPGAAEVARHDAIRLREAIYRIFTSVAHEETVAPADLALLNDRLRQALPHLRVTPSPPAFGWAWTESGDDLLQIVWPVARSAANLLTGEALDRVGQCADDRGCGYLFIDTSRNRSRRWCSMESCGNRAKVHRHYHRQRKDADQGS